MNKIKREIWFQLSKLRDRLPEYLSPPIDWLRYEVFYPEDDDY